MFPRKEVSTGSGSDRVSLLAINPASGDPVATALGDDLIVGSSGWSIAGSFLNSKFYDLVNPLSVSV
jgi:hypothetical protein